MLEVCLLGTGGTMPMPGRALTALMVRCGGKSTLIDCGEGTQVQIRQKKWSIRAIDHILITHLHGDHVIGLPGLLLSMGMDGRTEALNIWGPKGITALVNGLRMAAPGLPFPVQVRELEGVCSAFSCGNLRVEAFALDHSVPCLGYSLHLDRGRKFDPEKAIALNIPQRLWGRLQNGEAVEGFTPEAVLGEARQGLHVVYTTDTRPVDAIAVQARNADLLVCEGMYGDDGKLADAVEKKHMTFCEAGKLAAEAQAKQLWLTHFSPSLEEPETWLPDVQAVFPDAHIPQDLETLHLTWEK